MKVVWWLSRVQVQGHLRALTLCSTNLSYSCKRRVSFQRIFLGSLRVTTSIYPVPSICAQDQISDWFASLAECLHWNVRKKQKHFDELSDLTRCSSNDTIDSIDKFSDKLESA